MSSFTLLNNIPALNAARMLDFNSGKLATALERLSSGLRINTAADDPGGLSISESLRSQVRGLNRAAANALDGISLLQTASAGLTEITSILQSMRELAVSAADGTKTAGDRAAIQAEISEYLAQIDSLAANTEFNTKSLLNGSLGALVSTSDYQKLSAQVDGRVGRSGSYIIKPRALDAGMLERQVSDVLTVTASSDFASQVSGIETLRPGVTLVTDGGSGVGNTGLYRVELPNDGNGSIALAGFLSTGNNATLSITATTAATINAAGVSFAELFEGEEITSGDYIRFTFNNVSVVTLSIAVSAATDINTFLDTTLNTAMTGAGLGTARGTATGTASLALAGGVSLTGVTYIDSDNSGSKLLFSFDGSSGSIESNVFHNAVSVTFSNNGASTSANLTKSGANDSVLSVGNASTGTINIRFDNTTLFSSATGGVVGETDQFAFNQTSGYNNLQEFATVSFSGSGVDNRTLLVSATGSRTFALYDFDNSRYTSLVASGVDQGTALLASRGDRFFVDAAPASMTFSVGQTIIGEDLDDSSNTNPLTGLRLMFDGAILQAGERAVIDVRNSNVIRAGNSTTLASIDNFQAYGVFGGATSQTLDIYFEGRDGKATVTVNSTDTLEDLAGKISLALYAPDGSGLIGQPTIISPGDPPKLVTVNNVGNQRGTISITTPLPGDHLVITGNDDLVNALNLVVTTNAEAPTFSVGAINAVTGANEGSIITKSNRVEGLIDGVTLYFDNTAYLRLDSDPPTGNINTHNQWPFVGPNEAPALSITNYNTVDDLYLHVNANPLTMQIGSNAGETIEINIPAVDTRALDLIGLNVATEALASQAIGRLDKALDKATRVQARAGSLQNRLGSTVNYLEVAAENTQAAESRIRDADAAKEIIAVAQAQLLINTAAFAITQANLQSKAVLQLLQ